MGHRALTPSAGIRRPPHLESAAPRAAGGIDNFCHFHLKIIGAEHIDAR